jgi:hypothetical protein
MSRPLLLVPDFRVLRPCMVGPSAGAAGYVLKQIRGTDL